MLIVTRIEKLFWKLWRYW